MALMRVDQSKHNNNPDLGNDNKAEWWKKPAVIVAALGSAAAITVAGIELTSGEEGQTPTETTQDIEQGNENAGSVDPANVTSENFSELSPEDYSGIGIDRVNVLNDNQLTKVAVHNINSYGPTEIENLEFDATMEEIISNWQQIFLYTQSSKDPRGLWALFQEPATSQGYQTLSQQLNTQNGMESAPFLRNYIGVGRIIERNEETRTISIDTSLDPDTSVITEFIYVEGTFKILQQTS